MYSQVYLELIEMKKKTKEMTLIDSFSIRYIVRFLKCLLPFETLPHIARQNYI